MAGKITLLKLQNRCFSNMKLDLDKSEIQQDIHMYKYYFTKNLNSSNTNILEIGILVGDFVVLSTESGHFGISSGIVSAISESCVVIQLDQPLQVN